jgi:hypothetical protein
MAGSRAAIVKITKRYTSDRLNYFANFTIFTLRINVDVDRVKNSMGLGLDTFHSDNLSTVLSSYYSTAFEIIDIFFLYYLLHSQICSLPFR